jgi:hypothetical protein
MVIVVVEATAAAAVLNSNYGCLFTRREILKQEGKNLLIIPLISSVIYPIILIVIIIIIIIIRLGWQIYSVTFKDNTPIFMKNAVHVFCNTGDQTFKYICVEANIIFKNGYSSNRLHIHKPAYPKPRIQKPKYFQRLNSCSLHGVAA